MSDPPLQRVFNISIGLISPSHKLVKLRGEFCTLPSSHRRRCSSGEPLATLTSLLDRIERRIAVSTNFIILLLRCFYGVYFCSCFYSCFVFRVHIMHHPLCLIDPSLIMTPFKLKIGKFVCRMEGN